VLRGQRQLERAGHPDDGHVIRIDAGRGERRGDGPRARDAVAGEPRRERLLAVGADQRVRIRRRALDLTPQRVEGGELLGRKPNVGEPTQGRDQRRTGGFEGVDRPGGGGCRVVDLVREAGGERAEGDEGLALPCGRLDRACRVVEPLDEVGAEREPGAGPLAEHLGRHPEHPTGGRSPAGREVDAVLVPGAEPTGPAARHVHPRDHGVLAADVADEVDGPVEEHPPEVGVLALAEQVGSGLDANLGTALDQFSELIVGQAVEDAQRAELLDAHQIVAR
jgi:hypothetical protein